MSNELDGILVVDKARGLTSADVVRQVKHVVGSKVGHLGTLDPFATGVLPLCLGAGTKIAQFLNAADKDYTGVIRFGIQTDTGDCTGTEIRRAAVTELTAARCDAVASRFRGDQLQIPPMYSAIKRAGVPLYKLARRGVEVEREPRSIRIDALTLWPLDGERAAFELHCSKGTYVRVLAEDIGAALDTVGHLESLRRTRFAHFTLERAVTLPLTRADAEAALIAPRQALADVPEVALSAGAATQVRRGQVAALRQLDPPRAQPATAKLIAPDGTLLAIVTSNAAGLWEFARVLDQQPGAGGCPARPSPS